MSLATESGSFEVRWEDFIALGQWLRKNRPPKNREPQDQFRDFRQENKRNRASKNQRPRLSSLLVWGSAAVLAAFIYFSEPRTTPNLVLGLACFLGGFVAGTVVLFFLLRWTKFLHIPTEKNFLTRPADQWQRGPWRVRISPEGIESISSHSTTMDRWHVVWSMGQTDDYVIFMTSSQAGHAVPRRAFISEEHFNEFAESAKRFRCEATKVLDAEPAPPDEDLPEPEAPRTDIRL